jgi:1,4-dihydroxy-2-naphthoate octaprenyltransferase
MNFRVWLIAARPKTLWAGIAPVVMGSAMALDAGKFHWPSALCAMLGALLIQIGTNFANDYADHIKGADTAGRLGPLRVTQAGLVSPATVKWAAIIVFALACVPGLYLVLRAGWVFVPIGLVSIACGALYTAGPMPLGYMGLGDVFVLVFFGPVAVAGTYYVQAFSIEPPVVLAGVAAGLFSVAILTVNNLRDVEQDRVAGKRTLPVRFGRTFARIEYLSSIAIGAGVIPVYLAIGEKKPYILLCLTVLIVSAPTLRTVFTRTDGPSLNGALASTGKWLLLFSIIFSIGWNL